MGLTCPAAGYHYPRLGRFTSPDPIAGSTADPQTLNRFAYTRNDPVNLIDPLGLQHGCAFYVWTSYAEVGIEASGGFWEGFFCGGDPGDFASVEQNQEGRDVGGIGTPKRIRDIVNAALKQEKLAECLNKFFGPGTILTNQNLPRIDATKSSDQLGGNAGLTDPARVPDVGRSTVNVASDVVNNPLVWEWKQAVYLHEVGNALAMQRFTNEPIKVNRAYLGPRGGPRTAEQVRQAALEGGDADTGREFEKCIFDGTASGKP